MCTFLIFALICCRSTINKRGPLKKPEPTKAGTKNIKTNTLTRKMDNKLANKKNNDKGNNKPLPKKETNGNNNNHTNVIRRNICIVLLSIIDIIIKELFSQHLQGDKSDKEKETQDNNEPEERKFDPSGYDHDLVEMLGKVLNYLLWPLTIYVTQSVQTSYKLWNF